MQLTRVDVYNITLGKIKIGKRVHSLTDELVRRYMLSQTYELCLASLLERHPWSFATKEAKLGEVECSTATFPNFLRRHSWVYPHDCHKILAVGKYRETPVQPAPGKLPDPHLSPTISFDFSRERPWEVALGAGADRVIHTAFGHAAARYLTNQIPEALWPAGFASAMTWAMAAEITRGENASDADADYRLQQAMAAFQAAQRADAVDNGPGLRVPGDFIAARDVWGELAGYVGGEVF